MQLLGVKRKLVLIEKIGPPEPVISKVVIASSEKYNK
jgi:hypothetical protein